MHPNPALSTGDIITVVVQSVPARPVWERCRAAIEASDIGRNYTRLVHPAGHTYRDFVLNVFSYMAQARTPYVLRLEDDVTEVNSHILHNVLTWPALDEPRFGVGWLMDPGGLFSERTHVEKIHREPGRDGWQLRGLMHSCAVVFRTADLTWLRARVEEWFETHPYWDQSIGYALAEQDRCVVVHAPSLVDHDPEVPSALAHFGRSRHDTDTAAGTFRQDWMREVEL